MSQEWSTSVQKWIRHSPYCLRRQRSNCKRFTWGVAPRSTSRGGKTWEMEGRKPRPGVTVHRWPLWANAAQSHWGPLRGDRLCFSAVPPQGRESWDIYPPTPVCSWLKAAPGDVNSWVLPTHCICRKMHQEASSGMLSTNGYGWGTNNICYTYLQKVPRSKGKVNINHHLWRNSN